MNITAIGKKYYICVTILKKPLQQGIFFVYCYYLKKMGGV